MNRRFKILYYLLVAFFVIVFTYEMYQLAAVIFHRPARLLIVSEGN